MKRIILFLLLLPSLVFSQTTGPYTKEQLHKNVDSLIRTGLTPYKVGNLFDSTIESFQTPLVSGTDIKTINGTSLLGSGDITISGSAAPNVYYTSQNGLTSDAVITEGSSTFGVDDKAAFQTILNHASDGTAITVVVDGKYSISSTLLVYGHTRIIFTPGNGVILSSGANCTMFKNVNMTVSTTHTDTDIEFYSPGGGIINQNSAGNPTHNTNTDGWLVPIRLAGVDRIKIEGLTILSQRTFAVHISNSNYIKFINNFVDPTPAHTTSLVHTDGFHINGPASNIQIIQDNSLGQGDDAFSLCANDVFQSVSTGVQSYDPFASNGDISNWIIDSPALRDGHGLRLLSTVNKITDGRVSNFKGVVNNRAILMDNWQGGTPALPGNGYFENIIFEGIGIKMNFTAPLIILGGTMKGITIRDLTRDNTTYNNASATIECESNLYTEEITLDGIQIIGGVNSSPLFSGGGYIGRLHINNARNNPTVQYGAISQPLVKMNATYGGYIGTIQADNISWVRSTSLIDYSIGQIDNIQLNSVLFTYANAGLSAIVVGTGRTVKDVVVNNYTSVTPIIGGAGSYPTVRGSGFVGPLAGTNTLNQLGTFTAANGTALSGYTESGIGSTFSVQNSSDFEIQSNVLIPKTPTPSGNNWYVVNNIGVLDQEADFEVKVTTAGAVSQAYVRWTNSTNYVVVNLSSTLGSCNLTNVVAGTPTTFGTFTAAANTSDFAWHRVRVTAIGSNPNIIVTVYFDERTIATGTVPSSQTGTRGGFGCISATAPSVFSFDNYKGITATYSGVVSKGFTLQKLTTTQKNALTMVAADAGYEIFDTTLGKKCVYSGTAWETVTSN